MQKGNLVFRNLVTALVAFTTVIAAVGGVGPIEFAGSPAQATELAPTEEAAPSAEPDGEPADAATAAATPAPTPYVALFTEVGDCGQVLATNQLTGGALNSRLTELVSWYEHFHGQGSNVFTLGDLCRGSSSSTLAAKLASRGVVTSNYRNGSYVSQSSQSAPLLFDEAGDLEANAPLAIATFWPGNYAPYVAGDNSVDVAKLSGSLSAGATTVRVKSAASVRPSGEAATWPYRNSRGAGTPSRSVFGRTRVILCRLFGWITS